MPRKLLIVDGDVEIVSVLFDTLANLFDDVDFAYSVEEAWKVLTLNVYAVILVDIKLKNRNGAEVISFVLNNKENPNQDAAFVIVSGIINAQFVERYQNRFAGIVAKPFNGTDLNTKVKDILIARNMAPTETASEELIPKVRYVGPFVITELEQKVEEVLVQLKKSTKLKQLFKQMKIDRNADNYITTHIGMIINISAAICRKMEWSSDKTLEKFVYAAYLHDMALASRSDLARIGTLDKLDSLKKELSSEEYNLVFEHANIAAKIVAGMDELPPDVDMIIRQHHELPNERGFPTKCNAFKITPLSAIFIVAHDLTDYILEHPHWTMEEYIAKIKSKLHGSHFTKIIRLLAEIK